MEECQKLNRLEHFLLSSAMNDIEPLHILYSEAIDRFPNTTLKSIISGLVKLTNMGLLECFFDNYRKAPAKDKCDSLTEEQLERLCIGRTEQQLRQFPEKHYGGEYEFYTSLRGREEEGRDIYDTYYPDDE
jgi:hypothetical protein